MRRKAASRRDERLAKQWSVAVVRKLLARYNYLASPFLFTVHPPDADNPLSGVIYLVECTLVKG